MTTNALIITQAGEQASASAEAGGFKIKVTDFSVGDGNVDPSRLDVSLSGNVSYSAKISLVEVISPGVARFTLDLPPGDSSYTVKEVGVFLDSGVMFGRGVFSSPVTKDANIALRIFAVMAVTSCDLTTLEVTVGDIYSIPSVAFVHSLPAPNTSNHNTIAVLDQKYNFDGSSSAALAVKYGEGGFFWSFVGYSRIYFGVPDASGSGVTLSRTQFQVSSIAQNSTISALKNNELFIVQITSGPGQGESRRFTYATTGIFTELDGEPFSEITTSSHIAVWRATEGAGVYTPPTEACKWPPTMTGIPADWVLTRGTSCPTWVSPSTLGNNTNSSGLFTSAFELKPNAVYFTGNGKNTKFDTGLILNSNNTLISISGITQHKDAYDVQGTYVIFSEAPPPGTAIEVIVYSKETSSGVFLEFHTIFGSETSGTIVDGTNEYGVTGSLSSFTADGVTREFDLNIDLTQTNPYPASEHYVMCWITGIKQNLNAYLYEVKSDGRAYIIFNEAPKAGLDIQVTWIRKVTRDNYGTQMHVNTFFGTGVQETLELSVTPDDRNYVFVYISGILLHSHRYNLTGNRIIIPDAIKKDLPIMVVVFKNVLSEGTPSSALSGIVTGALVTDKYLRLTRYNAPDFLLPNQRVNLSAGDGIEVVGAFPNYTIKSITDSRRKNVYTKRFSNLYSQDNVEEIIYTYKFIYDIDVIVTITADFTCRLGPGFKSADGGEYIEYVVGFKKDNVSEPPYGRRIKGTGFAGFNYLAGAQLAYSNFSTTQSYELNLSAAKTDTVTFVAKMRVREGNISKYKSLMDINFSMIAVPKILEVTQ